MFSGQAANDVLHDGRVEMIQQIWIDMLARVRKQMLVHEGDRRRRTLDVEQDDANACEGSAHADLPDPANGK
jgi:hypothetical protein